jgi:hypothetical protein
MPLVRAARELGSRSGRPGRTENGGSSSPLRQTAPGRVVSAGGLKVPCGGKALIHLEGGFVQASCRPILSRSLLGLAAILVAQTTAWAGSPVVYKVEILFDRVTTRMIGPNMMDLRKPGGPRLPPQNSQTKITGFFMTDGALGPIGLENIKDYELNLTSTVSAQFNIRFSSRSAGRCDTNNGCRLKAANGTEVYFDGGKQDLFLEARADGTLLLRPVGVYFSMIFSNPDSPNHTLTRIRLASANGTDYLFVDADFNSGNRDARESYETERPRAPIGRVMQVDGH